MEYEWYRLGRSDSDVVDDVYNDEICSAHCSNVKSLLLLLLLFLIRQPHTIQGITLLLVGAKS